MLNQPIAIFRGKEKSMKAIFDVNGVIFGVGKDEEAAIVDANKWLGVDGQIICADGLGDYRDYQKGGYGYHLFINSCSHELAALVSAKGGIVGWEEDDNFVMIPLVP
jgi:hypothetical protein